MEETWVNFDKFYQVSSLGRVRSVDRVYQGNNSKKGITRKGKILKLNDRPNARYVSINLYLDGKKKTFLVHRLVALAFLENPENKPQVNHIDGDKKNNRLDNLEWVTASENNLHAYRTSLNKSFGERHFRTKLVDNEVKAIKLLHGLKSLEQLSEFFGVSKSTISTIYRDKSWKYLD